MPEPPLRSMDGAVALARAHATPQGTLSLFFLEKLFFQRGKKQIGKKVSKARVRAPRGSCGGASAQGFRPFSCVPVASAGSSLSCVFFFLEHDRIVLDERGRSFGGLFFFRQGWLWHRAAARQRTTGRERITNSKKRQR